MLFFVDYCIFVLLNVFNIVNDLLSFSDLMFLNRLYSSSRYWTGTSLQMRLMRGIFSNANDITDIPRMSLQYCTLVPVQYRGHKYGLFKI